jgi:hypothetical protein
VTPKTGMLPGPENGLACRRERANLCVALRPAPLKLYKYPAFSSNQDYGYKRRAPLLLTLSPYVLQYVLICNSTCLYPI